MTAQEMIEFYNELFDSDKPKTLEFWTLLSMKASKKDDRFGNSIAEVSQMIKFVEEHKNNNQKIMFIS